MCERKHESVTATVMKLAASNSNPVTRQGKQLPTRVSAYSET
jgi:hypothetical protein